MHRFDVKMIIITFLLGIIVFLFPGTLWAQNAVFSEVFHDTPSDENIKECIELYNNSSLDVSIGGWAITDNNGVGSSFTIPDGETIAHGTFYTVARKNAGFVNIVINQILRVQK